jgi:hypothetical protein
MGVYGDHLLQESAFQDTDYKPGHTRNIVE